MAKRITAIVSLAVIGILIVATLIMANITVNYKVNCNNPDSIWVYTSSVSSANAGRGCNDEEYKTILEAINSASKEKFLTALFNGSANKKAEIKEVTTTSDKNITSPSSANYSYFVCFRYNSPQTLKVGNKNFTDANGNNYHFGELYFGVKNVEGVNVFDVYVNSYENISTQNPVYKYHYYYELSADFTELYNYLSDKNW